MPNPRPAPVGLYHILTDFEGPTASVRVFRLSSAGDAIGSHLHRRSMQIYVALEGSVVVDAGGVETVLRPFEVLQVWPGTLHTTSPVDGDAVVMNISIPPLAADDQLAGLPASAAPDTRLPSAGTDIED